MSNLSSPEILARLRAASAVHGGVDANHAVERSATGPLPGEARRTGRGHVESFGERRICSEWGCDTVLSRYNRRTECGVHDSGRRS